VDEISIDSAAPFRNRSIANAFEMQRTNSYKKRLQNIKEGRNLDI
jgi:hypothetical protein